jgi:Zn-dependent M28 family amino/carboxypeptidase
VVSAHYDHLGVGPEIRGDAIYNGVIDNAIGCAGLLELARVAATLPERPERSIIVLFTTAEEEGNLGAAYFLEHPPIPLSSMIANINIDGLAFGDLFDDVVGIGAELSDLGEILRRVAKARGLEVGRPEEFSLGREAFERSDQALFAEYGIPAILINEGLDWRSTAREAAVAQTIEWFTSRYHTPFDDLSQPLDFETAAEHLEVIVTLTLAVTDAPVAPEWRPGVPYAYRRLLTLAEEKGRSPRP